ncbi:MAG: TfoX/Sxy family protein [Bacteroidetes bacterium]|nr:TfoX/Sxy family protein [Bacteroidota bacterium]
MAYNESLAQVIREKTEGTPGLVEKKMFGGIAFLLHGNMSVGVHKDDLIVRVGPDSHDDSLAKPHTRVFDITGRSMKGWVMVHPEGHEDEKALSSWIEKGLDFAATLPKK